jgi:hypothetical protein
VGAGGLLDLEMLLLVVVVAVAGDTTLTTGEEDDIFAISDASLDVSISDELDDR